MKKLLFLTILLFGQANAADLYYCKCDTGAASGCVAGSDNNDGLTPATAKQSGSNAKSAFSSLTPGDTIYFCKGGSWINDGNGSWSNSSSSASNRVNVSSYTPSWTPTPTARPLFTVTSASSMFNIGSGSGYTFSGLHIVCQSGVCNIDAGRPRGFNINNSADDVTVDDFEIENFTHGVGVLSDSAGSGNYTTGIVIQNSEIHHNTVQGIYAETHGLTIDSNYIHHNGGQNFLLHNVYIGKSSNIIIRNNDIYKSSTGSGEICGGVSVVIHGTGDNYLVEGNYIHEEDGQYDGNCWGLSFYPGYGYAEGWTNVTIRKNIIKNLDGNYMVVSNCDTCLIENNIIINTSSSGGNPIKLVSPSELWNNRNVTVQNNTIYHSTSAGTAITVSGNAQTGIVIVNNAIQYDGTNNSFNCFSFNSSTFTQIDNNICYHPNASAAEWEDGSGSLSSWQSSTVWDANSSESNPGFIDPAKGDFRLTSSSAAINMGNTTYYAVRDYIGLARGVNPDVGAFEGLYNPPAATALYLE